MQKKLFFFHTFALVTAMAILLAVNSGVLHVVMDYYQRRAIPAADERSQQARAVLDSWDEKDEDWDKLSKRLRAADYDLVVCRDGEIVSSGLDQALGQQLACCLQDAGVITLGENDRLGICLQLCYQRCKHISHCDYLRIYFPKFTPRVCWTQGCLSSLF